MAEHGQWAKKQGWHPGMGVVREERIIDGRDGERNSRYMATMRVKKIGPFIVVFGWMLFFVGYNKCTTRGQSEKRKNIISNRYIETKLCTSFFHPFLPPPLSVLRMLALRTGLVQIGYSPVDIIHSAKFTFGQFRSIYSIYHLFSSSFPCFLYDISGLIRQFLFFFRFSMLYLPMPII
jgi:hypothetical protein